MNSAFLRFRLRQAGKFIREIPVIYLVILTGILLIAGIALYQFTKDLHGSLIIAGILLVFLSLIQLRRKDYHFIYLAEKKAWKVFSMDYFLLSLPVLIIISVNLFWYVSLAIIAGCISLGFIKQPFHRTKKGMNSPKWIPAEAFELRSGIRQYGGLLLILYVSAWIGLLLPFASLASLWFFTVIVSDIFRFSEPVQILCSQERPVNRFLHGKLRLNLKLFLYATTPVCAIYTLLYPEHWWFILTFLAAVSLNITLFIINKYAHYLPNTKITGGQVPITIAVISIFFPVLLPVVLFFLVKNYLAARRNLTTYLYAYNPESTSRI